MRYTKSVLESSPNPTNQTALENRTRYALLVDRRRALHEIYRLTERTVQHPRWEEVSAQYFELELLISAQLNGAEKICSGVCRAEIKVLEGRVCEAYRRLSVLAKVWVALEDDQDMGALLERLEAEV